MSLNFNVAEIKDWKKVTTSPWNEKKWHPVTESLIWLSMSVDLGDITEENIDEWWFRVRMLQLFDGAEITSYDGTKAFLTMEDLKMHIGLRTNVTDKKRKHWLERIFSSKQQEFLKTSGQSKSAYTLCQEQFEAQQKVKGLKEGAG